MIIKKLTKAQRRVIQMSLEAWEIHGENVKPIYCDVVYRGRISTYSKSYASYNKQMYQLLDAGIIEAVSLTLCKLTSIQVARDYLKLP